MAKATKTTRRTKTAKTTSAPSPGLSEVPRHIALEVVKDIHLEKDNHKVCFHWRENTVSVVEYLDDKIATSEGFSTNDANDMMASYLEDGYEIVHPTTPDDHA